MSQRYGDKYYVHSILTRTTKSQDQARLDLMLVTEAAAKKGLKIERIAFKMGFFLWSDLNPKKVRFTSFIRLKEFVEAYGNQNSGSNCQG